MPEPGGDEGMTVGGLGAGVPAPHLARMTFQVRDRGIDGALMAAHHRSGRHFVPEPPNEGHPLRRRQREVEAGERRGRRAGRLPRRRIVASEDRAEIVGADLAVETDGGGARAEPSARCLPAWR